MFLSCGYFPEKLLLLEVGLKKSDTNLIARSFLNPEL